jgi:hypothetical protein
MRTSLPKGRSIAAGLLFLGITVGSCVDSTGPTVLTTPTDVRVTLIGPHTARITWAADALEIDYIEGFNIYRDGVKIGQTRETSFTDNNLVEGVTYKYRVSAEGFGIVSELSAESGSSAITVPDITAPTVSSTNPVAGAAGVARSATVSATFSEALDATTVSGSTFFIKTSGGALLPAAVSYTTATRTALLTPTSPLPNASTITATITTGIKDVAGNKLAADFTFSFTTRDEIPPTVVSTSPANGASGVQPNAPITVTFSEAMDASTIAAAITLKLTSSGASVGGNVAYNPATLTATFTPISSLAFGAGYTLGVSTGAKDVSGNALASAVSSSFTTSGAPDTTPPSVVSVSPVNGAPSVAVNTSISIQFSEAMDANTINSLNVLLRTNPGGATVTATVSYDAGTNTATLTPSSALSFSAGYSVIVTTEARDVAGNPLSSNFLSSFNTAAAPDITPPNVSSVTPAHLASGVSTSTTVSVVFSEQMNPNTVNSSTIVLTFTGTATTVAGVVSYNPANNTATLTPSSLAFSTSYTVTVNGVTDLAGNGLTAPFTSIFATGAAPDITPPDVSSSSPINGAIGVARTVAPTVTFNEAMKASTIDGSTIVLRVTSSGTPVAGVVSYDPGTNTATFTPSGQLSFATQYTLSVTTGVQDLAGNPMASQFNATFTVMSNPDATPPTVIGFARIGAAGPPLENRSMASVTFSEAMNPSTLNTSTVTMKNDLNGNPVSGTVSYDSNTNTVYFLASAPLTYSDQPGGTSYTLTIATGAQDLAGNGLAAPYTLSSTRLGYFQGTNDATAAQPAVVHIHVSFAQNGSTLSRAVECTPLSGGADCDVLPRNQQALDAFGPLDDGAAATITALSGTFTNPGITFTFTLANGKSFTFTGNMTSANAMTGTLTGATLSTPISIVLSR